MEMGTLIFDIDGTICSQEQDYSQAKPYNDIIQRINQKYDEGYRIVYFTARGTETGIDWSKVTHEQLKQWGAKYHKLQFGKPAGLQYIDDKGINIHNWEPDIQSEAGINKQWGKEYLLAKTDLYAFKRLEIYQDKCISNQVHWHKEETWHIVEGTGLACVDGIMQNVGPGSTVHIPPAHIHQVMATSNKLVIIEASTTELDDIVRFSREWSY